MKQIVEPIISSETGMIHIVVNFFLYLIIESIRNKLINDGLIC